MTNRAPFHLAVLALACGAAGVVTPRVCAEEPANDAIAAKVDGKAILVRDVRARLKRTEPDRANDSPPREVPSPRERAALEAIVRQRLALAHLERKELAASASDVEHEIETLRKDLKRIDKTLDDHLAATGQTLDQLREEVRWRLSWTAFLLEKLNDANMEKYFDAHRADFDGRIVHVAHILWAHPIDDTKGRKTALVEAKELAQQIRMGKTSFAEAARAKSAAPSAADGGDIGPIERHAPMDEAFSAAAFALQVDQISEPIETAAGVHLVRCLKVETGKKTWRDCREPLKQAVARYLFDSLVEQQRPKSRVELFEPWRSASAAP